MKIKDLIEQLQKLDQEAHVLVDGYEGGYDDLLIKVANVIKRQETSWCGTYGYAYDKKPNFRAIIIGRSFNYEHEDFFFSEDIKAWKQGLEEKIIETLGYRNHSKDNNDSIDESVREYQAKLAKLNNPVT